MTETDGFEEDYPPTVEVSKTDLAALQTIIGGLAGLTNQQADDLVRLRYALGVAQTALEMETYFDYDKQLDVCPWCKAEFRIYAGRQPGEHAPDCRRQAALAAIQEVLK